MKDILNKIFKNKKIILPIIIFCFVFIFLAAKPVAAAADLGSAIASLLGWIVSLLSTVVGWFLSFLIKILINVAKFNDIINVPAVMQGWVMVRDLGNMFFILILLVIAFATILRIESYNVKKMLPKLLIMAVLINFSKTIFGLIIDFSQVIMLTFIGGLGGDVAQNNLISIFQVQNMLSIPSATTASTAAAATAGWGTSVGIIAGFFALLITLIVVVVLLAVLIMRVMMLWIYTILSPLVFLGFAFPPIQKYTGQIWEDFIKQVIVGPMLAFFLWLALIAASTSTTIPAAGNELCIGGITGAVNSLFCEGNFQKYIITIALLIGGLMVTQKIGGAAGSIAGKGMAWAKRAPLLVGGGALAVGGWGARKVKMGSVSKMFASYDDKTGAYKDRKFLPGGKYIANALHGLELRPTRIYKGIKEGLKAVEEEDEVTATSASADRLKKGGVGGLIKGLGVSRDLTEALVSPGGVFMHKGIRRAWDVARSNPEKTKEMNKEIEKRKEARKEKSTDSEIKQEEDKVKDLQKNLSLAVQNGNDEEATKLKELLKVSKQQLAKMRANRISDDDGKKIDDEINGLEQKMARSMPVQTYYADRERESLIRQEQQKFGGKDNEEELVALFNNALANNDKNAAAAVMLQAAKVGHLNEIIESQKSDKDVHDENGKLVIRKGDYLRAGQHGFNELINQKLIKDLGISQQQAYGLQSEASSLAKSVGHMGMSESVGTKNGFFYQRTAETQRKRARGEFRKKDMERGLRDYNRLAWGDEYTDASGKRSFKLNEIGLDNFTEWADGVDAEIDRGRFNKNAAMNIAQDRETLYNYVKELKDKGITHFTKTKKVVDKKTGEEKEEITKISYEDLAKKLVGYGDNVYKLQAEEEQGSEVKSAKAEVMEKQRKQDVNEI